MTHSLLSSMLLSHPGRGAERNTGHKAGQRQKGHRLPRNLIRGQGYITPSGVLGYFVGTSPLGRNWFCFGRLPEFRELCRRFDEQFGSPVRTISSDSQRHRRAKRSEVA